MGNTLIIIRNRRSAKVMKLNGEIIKYKTPIQVEKVLKDYSTGHVLLDAEAVKHLGIRAKPLDPWKELKPKKLYFIVELPDPPVVDTSVNKRGPETRRVRSVIHMSAKDRLETLMLSRRSASDLMVVRHRDRDRDRDRDREVVVPETAAAGGGDEAARGVRVKVWLPKAEVEKLMRESKTEAEAAEKIAGLYVANKKLVSRRGDGGGNDVATAAEGGNSRHVRWKD